MRKLIFALISVLLLCGYAPQHHLSVISQYNAAGGGAGCADTEIWTAAGQTGASTDEVAATNQSQRNYITSDVSASATTVKVCLYGPAGNTVAMDDLYIGPKQAASDPYDFSGAPTQLLFSSSASFTVPQAGEICSDEASFAMSAGNDYLVSGHMTTSGTTVLRWNPGSGTHSADKYAASTESSTQDVTSYSERTWILSVSRILKCS